MRAQPDEIRELIEDIARARDRANKLGMGFLSDLLAAGMIEAAIQWDGGSQAFADPSTRIDTVIRMKLRTLLGPKAAGVT